MEKTQRDKLLSIDGIKSSTYENILIQGDNCEVLEKLQTNFKNQIKCIYIDPPYNNGETYHYYNDNTEHHFWIKSLNRVLSLLKPLMSNDGSIWISIDDQEMAYLKIEADKVFGRMNFVGTIIWQQRKSRENRATFSCNHEYILVYAKNINSFRKSRNLLPVDENYISKKYKNPDNDPRGPWQSVTANVQAGHAVPSQFYVVVSPAGIKHIPPKGRCWIYNEKRMKREIANGNIWFGKEGKNAPRVKKFLRDAKIGLTPETIWLADEVGTSDSAKKQLISMFPDKENIFETPKPEGLLKRIIEIASNENDYVLDCYLGSGTTIAVAHKLGRHYIGIEIGKQMSEIAVKRMNIVVEGDQSGISKDINWHGGGQFNFFYLDKNHILQSNSSLTQLPLLSPINDTKISTCSAMIEGNHYKQLDFLETLHRYPDIIYENNTAIKSSSVKEPSSHYSVSRNILICLIKPDIESPFLNGSAKLYYTGKRFPLAISLDKLYYFMPYIKNKGVRDLYLIKRIRIGTHTEGQPKNNLSDLRLIFEIGFVKKMFKDYQAVKLQIWKSYTCTTIDEFLI